MSRHFLSLRRVHSDGKRFIVRADEKLTAFLELEAAIRKNSIDILCRRLGESQPR